MIEKILYILFAVLHIHIKIIVFNRKCYKITILRKRKAWLNISWAEIKPKMWQFRLTISVSHLVIPREVGDIGL